MRKNLAGVLILGASLIASAIVFGSFFYQSRMPEKTIRVVGAATRRIDSDVVKWRVTIARNVGPDELKSGYTAIRGDLETLVGLLKARGITGKDVTVQPVNTSPVFNREKSGPGPIGYQIRQSVYIVSQDLPKLEELALNPGLMVDKGIVLQSSNLEYYPSKLSKVKKELLAEATTDARERAGEIARSSGDRLARIESARVGVFQITEPYSTEVSDYGIYNTSTREKDITVTVNVSFTLK